MEALSRNISVIIACVVVLVLHVVVTPALAISLIRPNALLAYAAVISIVRPNNVSLVASFILGLLGGMLSSYPVGLMAATAVVISFILCRVFSVVDNSSLFMVVASIAIAMLIGEVLYGFMLTKSLNVSFLSLLIYRILPCALYDCVFAFVLYPLVHRFVGPVSTATQIPVAQFR